MNKKIMLATSIAMLLSFSSLGAQEAAGVEQVYDTKGELLVPNYPILDKRSLSVSRGGEKDDYKAANDGIGVMIVGKKGETVNPAYGEYNSLLRTLTEPGVTISDLFNSGELTADDLAAANNICLNPIYSCPPGLSINAAEQHCEAPATCADSTMEFNGDECVRYETTRVPAIPDPTLTHYCASGTLDGTNCILGPGDTMPATVIPDGYTISDNATVEYSGQTYGIEKSGNYFRMITRGMAGNWVTVSEDGKSLKSPGYSLNSGAQQILNKADGIGYEVVYLGSWRYSPTAVVDSSNNISRDMTVIIGGRPLYGFKRVSATHFKYMLLGIESAQSITFVPYGDTYTCSVGTLSGTSCIVDTTIVIPADTMQTYSCPEGTLDGAECIVRTSLETPLEVAPVTCTAGTFDPLQGKCTTDIVRTCN